MSEEMERIIEASAESARRYLAGVCSAQSCPFHPGSGNWGMSPEAWEDMKQWHIKYHTEPA